MWAQTEHHGRRTDGLVPVFSNTRLRQNFIKVQGFKTLRFCFVLLFTFAFIGGVFAPSLSFAQSGDVINRLNRLENELDTLNRAVYKGEKPKGPVYLGSGASGAHGDAAQTEIRLQQMESQLRDLTGRVEKQTFEINRLRQKLELLSLKDSSALSDTDDFPRRNDALPDLTRGSKTSGSSLGTANNKPLDLNFIPEEPQGMKQVVPGGVNRVGVDATSQYEAAFAYLKSEKYEKAQDEFQSFLDNNETHLLAANAKYWLGETYYGQGKYKEAAKNFAEGFQKYPDSAKSPDILLKLGMSLARMDKRSDACIALAQVAKKFPVGHDNVIALANQEGERLGCE